MIVTLAKILLRNKLLNKNYMVKLFKSSIARKIAMALSAIFLIVFLVIHLAVNLTSVFSEGLFNQLSHFMGTNPLVQFGLQPVLMFGVIFHFVLGFVLEIQNKKARGNNAYAVYKGSANASWMSRNMIISGGFILVFLIIHLGDFWVHEMKVKYVQGDMSGLMEEVRQDVIASTTVHPSAAPYLFKKSDFLTDEEKNNTTLTSITENNPKLYRYYEELQEKFHPTWRVALYVIGFVFLYLHLLHGFKSSMQSVGVLSIRQKQLVCAGKIYSFIIAFGFIFVALFHYVSQFIQ